MKSIPKIIIGCGLVLVVMQSAIAANTTAASAPVATQGSTDAAKPGVVIIDREQLKKRLEDRGIQAKKKRDLARKKTLEQQGQPPATGN